MFNKFLFLVALTPKNLLTPLRERLQQASFASLNSVKYDNFRVLLFGDEDKVDGNLTFISAPNGKKGDRLKFALEYIEKHEIAFDYIARFDDDDFINPTIFDQYKFTKCNAIADKYHGFVDLGTCKTITTFRNWMANTVLMCKEDAFANMPNGKTLIEQDHAEEWHNYFKKKEVLYAPKNNPIYLRLLSPTSETANIDEDYNAYLKSFGNWKKPIFMEAFKQDMLNIKNISEAFFPKVEKNVYAPKKWWRSVF